MKRRFTPAQQLGIIAAAVGVLVLILFVVTSITAAIETAIIISN